jgi:hypothetical protein
MGLASQRIFEIGFAQRDALRVREKSLAQLPT